MNCSQVGGQIINVIGDASISTFDRRFEKNEIVDAGERRQRSDQTNVRTFRVSIGKCGRNVTDAHRELQSRHDRDSSRPAQAR